MLEEFTQREDWHRMQSELNARGVAVCARVLQPHSCTELIGLYAGAQRFRSKVVMARHGFGDGEYQYFNYPLPPVVQRLREVFYRALVPVGNDWAKRLKFDVQFPAELDDMLRRCHAGGQQQPTPLLLQYRAGGYNCLHQDLYGSHVFPLQVAILLSKPGCDFTGGEFVVTEQRPRMQSRVEVVDVNQGDAVIFAVNERPKRGTRGEYRVKHRHGVSKIRSGERYALGIIFHDAA